jgi:hypothetical protein
VVKAHAGKDGSVLADVVSRRTAELYQQTYKNPQDVRAWLQFVEHQPEAMHTSGAPTVIAWATQHS